MIEAILIRHVAPLFVDTVTLGFLLKSDTLIFGELQIEPT